MKMGLNTHSSNDKAEPNHVKMFGGDLSPVKEPKKKFSDYLKVTQERKKVIYFLCSCKNRISY